MGFIKNSSELSISDNRKIVLQLIEAALSSIQPKNVMSENFKLENNELIISNNKYDLNNYQNIYLLAFGKGSAGISKIIEETLGDKLLMGFCIDTTDESFAKIKFTKGTHPLPSEENLNFTKSAVKQLKNLTERDLVLIVICGGGSVMFENPYKISLDKLIEVNQKLLDSGADIYEMNTIRKHLSSTKGGGLVKLLGNAKIAALIFSDVPGNDLSFIASGPSVLDKTTKDDALLICRKYNIEIDIENFTETPKDIKSFEKVDNILMLSNLTALNSMKDKCKELKINCKIYSDKFKSDSKVAGKELIENTDKNSILLAGGETTVKIKNHDGKGGRNQVVVLSSLYELKENMVITSFDSDGWDNSPVAGAIGDLETLEKAKKLGLNPHEYLEQDNSLVFFKNIRDAIITDRLESNVSDLFIVYKK